MSNVPASTDSPTAFCADALIGELIFSVLLHDLRGELGVAQGWVEVAAMDGRLDSTHLDRSLAALQELISTAEKGAFSHDRPPSVSTATLLKSVLGARLPADPPQVLIDIEQFKKTVELAAPESITVEAKNDSDWVVLKMSGLSEVGVRHASRPSLSGLTELRRSPGDNPTLGAALLRGVARAAGGHLHASDATTVELHLKRGSA